MAEDLNDIYRIQEEKDFESYMQKVYKKTRKPKTFIWAGSKRGLEKFLDSCKKKYVKSKS